MSKRRRLVPPVQFALLGNRWLQQAQNYAAAAIEATLEGATPATGETPAQTAKRRAA
jgi:hypothetical protein